MYGKVGLNCIATKLLDLLLNFPRVVKEKHIYIYISLHSHSLLYIYKHVIYTIYIYTWEAPLPKVSQLGGWILPKCHWCTRWRSTSVKHSNVACYLILYLSHMQPNNKLADLIIATTQGFTIYDDVVELIEMGNIRPGVGFEPTSLTHSGPVCLLTVTPPRLSDVITLSKSICLCTSLYERSVQIRTHISHPVNKLINNNYLKALITFIIFN